MATLEKTGTFADYLDFWLDHARGRVRAKTWEGYECLIRVHARPALGQIALADLSPLDIQGLYSTLLARKPPLSGGTVLNLHLVITQALGQAVRWGHLGSNPAQGAQAPRPRRKESAVVDKGASERILEAASGTRMEAPAAIAIATGMRRGEILGLYWSDLSKDCASAQVARSLQWTAAGLVFERPKTARSRRLIVLPEFLHPYLERQKESQEQRRDQSSDWEETGLVIDRADGHAWDPRSFTSTWRAFLIKASLPRVRFHDLRHAHATLMLQQGVHPKIVSERLGHASIGITLDTYSHVLPSMQQDAADAFDEIFAE
jgi:integrase